MRILLDTHMLLWWLSDSPRLPEVSRTAIAASANDVHVSSISLAEISIKRSAGKLDAPWIADELLLENGMGTLDFGAAHARQLLELPLHHRDPFDRMLPAQALHEDLVFATVDRRARQYGVRLLPAA